MAADHNLVEETIKLLACRGDSRASQEDLRLLEQSQRAACELVALWAVRDDAAKLLLYEKGVFEHLRRLSMQRATALDAQATLRHLGVSFLSGA